MFVLTVAAAGYSQIPTVVLEHLEGVTDFHYIDPTVSSNTFAVAA